MNGYVQHAKLYDGRLENGESHVFHFEYDDLPNTGCSAALRWYEIAAAVTPGCSVTWRREWDSQDQANALQSVVHARLSWCNAATDEVVSMSCADEKLAFEHYVDWPSSLAELSLKIGALPRSDTLTAKDFEERIVKFVIDAFPESFRDRAPPRVRLRLRRRGLAAQRGGRFWPKGGLVVAAVRRAQRPPRVVRGVALQLALRR